MAELQKVKTDQLSYSTVDQAICALGFALAECYPFRDVNEWMNKNDRAPTAIDGLYAWSSPYNPKSCNRERLTHGAWLNLSKDAVARTEYYRKWTTEKEAIEALRMALIKDAVISDIGPNET